MPSKKSKKQKQQVVQEYSEDEVEETKYEIEEEEDFPGIKKIELLSLCGTTEDIDLILKLSKNKDSDIRLKAVKQLCPCKVQKDFDEFWKRVFEMVEDPDDRVRYQILHTICDGSPSHLELDMKNALEKFNQDSDTEIRRKAHKVLASYIRTGKWNVL